MLRENKTKGGKTMKKIVIICSLALVLISSLLIGCANPPPPATVGAPILGDAVLTTICAGDLDFDDLSICGEEACLNPIKYWRFSGLPGGSSCPLPFTAFLRNESESITIDSIKVADTFEHGTVTMQYQDSALLPGEVIGIQLTIHIDRRCPPGEYPFAIVFQATGHKAR
jgi:hypothetical protein